MQNRGNFFVFSKIETIILNSGSLIYVQIFFLFRWFICYVCWNLFDFQLFFVSVIHVYKHYVVDPFVYFCCDGALFNFTFERFMLINRHNTQCDFFGEINYLNCNL